jgi:hypothetical protein
MLLGIAVIMGVTAVCFAFAALSRRGASASSSPSPSPSPSPPRDALHAGVPETFYITKKTHLADAGVTLQGPQRRALSSPGFG